MTDERQLKTVDPVPLRSSTLAFLIVMAAGFVIAIVWVSFPEIDLWVSELFATGKFDGARRFPLRDSFLTTFLNDLIDEGALYGGLLILFGLIFTSASGRNFLGLTARKYWFLLSSLIAGPLLIANAVFKENWGRARPRDVTEFGGDYLFTPPLVVTDQCDTNCSFVSGDASLAFTMLAIALAVPQFRIRWVALATGFGVVIGLTRIVQGAHFLSDTLFAAIFMTLAVLLMYMIVIEKRWGVSAFCERWVGGGACFFWRKTKQGVALIIERLRPGSRAEIQDLSVKLGLKNRSPEMCRPVFNPASSLKDRVRIFFAASLDDVNLLKTGQEQEEAINPTAAQSADADAGTAPEDKEI